MFDITQEDLELAPHIPPSPSNCTVISILPWAVKENKPQIIPGYFQMPPSRGTFRDTNNDVYQIPVCLPVGESIFWMESPFKGMPPMKITETARAMAKSIVNDLIEAQLAVDTDAAPGLFWMEGQHDYDSVRSHHLPELRKAVKNQNRWFVNLVRIADDDWATAHQHRFISDIQRHAARHLGLKRDWLDLTTDAIQEQCPLCKELVRVDAIVHAACGYVLKPQEHQKLLAAGLILEAFAKP